jgi:hypothetical protein
MIIIFIISILFLVISITCLLIIGTESNSRLSKINVVFILMIGIGTVLFIYSTDDSPKPIDVYRNKTTLQITYRIQGLDTLSKDTIVVWKK